MDIKQSKTMNGLDQFVYNHSNHNHDMPTLAWKREIEKNTRKFFEMKNMEESNQVYPENVITELANDQYKFYVIVANDEPFYADNAVLIELYLMYVHKPITLYIDKKWYDNAKMECITV